MKRIKIPQNNKIWIVLQDHQIEDLNEILDNKEHCTDFEIEFINTVLKFNTYSPKQYQYLAKILNKFGIDDETIILNFYLSIGYLIGIGK
jgi:hypothetical protein